MRLGRTYRWDHTPHSTARGDADERSGAASPVTGFKDLAPSVSANATCGNRRAMPLQSPVAAPHPSREWISACPARVAQDRARGLWWNAIPSQRADTRTRAELPPAASRCPLRVNQSLAPRPPADLAPPLARPFTATPGPLCPAPRRRESAIERRYRSVGRTRTPRACGPSTRRTR
jgi:hypothetical protein